MARIYRGLDVQSDHGGSFPWKSQRVEVSRGISQAFVDEGPRDAPLTFLCLHGNPTWSYLYRRFIRALSPTYRVIAVDHVGFGRSDKPTEPGWYTLDRHVQNLSVLLDHLAPRRVVPVIQDWGGPIGMGWATAHPDQVAGVVVLNTWAFVKDPPLALPWLFRFLVLGKGGWKRSTRRNIFVELFLVRGGQRKLSTVEANAYRAPFPTPAERIGIARFPQLIPPSGDPDHESWPTMARIEDGLAKLHDKPALICWALKDPAFKKPALDRWTRVFAKVDGPHRLANAGHYLQEDAPDDILARLEPWAKGLAAMAAKPEDPVE